MTQKTLEGVETLEWVLGKAQTDLQGERYESSLGLQSPRQRVGGVPCSNDRRGGRWTSITDTEQCLGGHGWRYRSS